MGIKEATVPVQCDSCGYESTVNLSEIYKGDLKALGVYSSGNDRWYMVENIVDGEKWFQGVNKNEVICDECFATLQFEQDYDPRSEALTAAQRNPGGV